MKIMNKNREGFSLSAAMILLLVVSVGIAASMQLMTIKKDFEVKTSGYVNKCIAGEGAADLASDACDGTVEGCYAEVGKDCNTLFSYVDDYKEEVFKVSRAICDRGGEKACLFLMDQCVKNDECDLGMGSEDDLNYYLNLAHTVEDDGREIIERKGIQYYNQNLANFKAEVDDVCAAEWTATKTKDSTACKIQGTKTGTVTYGFEENTRPVFNEEDSENGTTFTDGKVEILPEADYVLNLYSCGDGGSGQLGHGDTSDRNFLAEISLETGFSQIAAGLSYSCALKDDGSAWCWGDNTKGILGLGDTSKREVPTEITSTTGFSKISTSYYENTCAVKTDGTAWCWGSDNRGQLGIGKTGDKYIPTEITSTTGFSDISVGREFACAVKTDGSAWCWGRDDVGQLGQGISDDSDKYIPTEITSTTGFSQISSGEEYTCALKDDGSAWCWGHNNNGQLGLGDQDERESPTQITSTTGFTKISTLKQHTCAIKDDGSVWCWGRNNNGQLGLGHTTTPVEVPTKITSETGFIDIAAGEEFTCGVKSNGSAWCWGRDNKGQLGLGDIGDQLTPTEITSETGFFVIATGDQHTVAGKRVPINAKNQAYVATSRYNRISGISAVTSVTIDQSPSLDSADVKWIISSDQGATWKAWNGSNWATVASGITDYDLSGYDFSDACTAQDVVDHLDEYDFPGGETHLDFAFELSGDPTPPDPSNSCGNQAGGVITLDTDATLGYDLAVTGCNQVDKKNLAGDGDNPCDSGICADDEAGCWYGEGDSCDAEPWDGDPSGNTGGCGNSLGDIAGGGGDEYDKYICNHVGAVNACSALNNGVNFGDYNWRLPDNTEMEIWRVNPSSDSNLTTEALALELCHKTSGHSPYCYTYSGCNGTNDDECHPYRVWSAELSGSLFYRYTLWTSLWYGPFTSTNSIAASVRCVRKIPTNPSVNSVSITYY